MTRTEPVNLRILSTGFTITSDDPEWTRVLTHLWHRFETGEAADALHIHVAPHRSGWSMVLDGRDPLTGSDPWLLADEMRHFIVDTALGRARGAFVDLHAACLVGGGRCVLLVGGSGTGKTTLTIAMGDQGWTCLSDDISIFERASGQVISFPKPVGVRDVAMWDRFSGRWEVPNWPVRPVGALLMPSDVLPFSTESHASPTHVVFVEFGRRLETHLEPLSTAQAVAQTGPFTRAVDPATISLFTKVFSSCTTASLEYRSAEEATNVLNRWFERADD